MTMPTHLGYGLERLQDQHKGTRCSEELLFRYNKKTNCYGYTTKDLLKLVKNSETDLFIIQPKI